MTKSQITELNKIINEVPEEKRAIAKNLAKEIRFMSETLDDLKEQIKKFGTIELFEQGKQKFLRENPAVKSYNTAVARYSGLYKQLVDLMPKTAVKPPESELMSFINEI